MIRWKVNSSGLVAAFELRESFSLELSLRAVKALDRGGTKRGLSSND